MGEKEFVQLAKEQLVKAYNERKGTFAKRIKEDDLYVVWLTKVLQNNKALISTNIRGDGLCFEVTYNGDKKELYLDVYRKIENICIKGV